MLLRRQLCSNRFLLLLGPQQQTCCALLQRANGRQMDIVLLHRSCSVYYAGSADKHRTLYTDTLPFVTNKKLTFSVRAIGHDKLENVGIEMNVVWAKYTGDEFDAVFHVVIVVILQTLNKHNVNAD